MSGDRIERIAWDLIARFGDLAAPVARELAAVSDEIQEHMLYPTELWRDIINTIERLHRKGALQNFRK
jgi:hypothetical protein